ncbi:MAG: hypothetical protein MHM6MM_002434 [Cercozoa sp. M6MM]
MDTAGASAALGPDTNVNVKAEETVKYELEKGEYQLVVRLHEARGLVPSGRGQMADPVGVVSLFEFADSTLAKPQTLSPRWDAVFTLNLGEREPREIETESLRIAVLDASGSGFGSRGTKSLIGEFRAALDEIYFRPRHELRRQWVALGHPKGGETRGYLLVSVAVLGPGDELAADAFAEDDTVAGDPLDAGVSVLLPPTIEQRRYLLHLDLFECRDLPFVSAATGLGVMAAGRALAGQAAAAAQPFLVLSFGGEMVRTPPAPAGAIEANKGNLSPLLRLSMPVTEPQLQRRLKLALVAQRSAYESVPVAAGFLDYRILKQKWKLSPRWLNFYGAPIGQQPSNAEGGATQRRAFAMNVGNVGGTAFRGRVLLRCEMEEVLNPEPAVSEIARLSDTPMSEWDTAPEQDTYVIICDVYAVGEIMTSPALVQLTCGGQLWRSPVLQTQGGFALVGRSIGSGQEQAGPDQGQPGEGQFEQAQGQFGQTQDGVVVTLPKDVSQCPDVFVYLATEQTGRQSFLRVPLSRLIRQAPAHAPSPPQWREFSNDKAEPAAEHVVFAGAALMSLRASRLSDYQRKQPSTAAIALNRPFLPQNLPLLQVIYGDNDLSKQAETRAISAVDLRRGTLKIFLLRSRRLCIPGRVTAVYATARLFQRPNTLRKALNIKQKKRKERKKSKHAKEFAKVFFPGEDAELESEQLNYCHLFEPRPHGRQEAMAWPEDGAVFEDVAPFAPETRLRVEFFDAVNGTPEANDRSLGFVEWNLSDVLLSSACRLGEERDTVTKEKWVPLSEAALRGALTQLRVRFVEHPLEVEEAEQVPMPPLLDANLGMPQMQRFLLRAYVWHARGLPAAKANGTSDAYLVVRCGTASAQTVYVSDSVNPLWFQVLQLSVALPVPLAFAPDIKLVALSAGGETGDVTLGELRLPLVTALRARKRLVVFRADAAALEEDEMEAEEGYLTAEQLRRDASLLLRAAPMPRWLPLRRRDAALPRGSVLASFLLLDEREIAPLSVPTGTAQMDMSGPPLMPALRPPMRLQWLHLVILGLRGVQHQSISLRKLSVRVIAPDGAVLDTQASASPSVSNANILEVLKFPLLVPTRRRFSPVLEVHVIDHVLKLGVERVVARTFIPLAQFVPDEHGRTASLNGVVESLDVHEETPEEREDIESRSHESGEEAVVDSAVAELRRRERADVLEGASARGDMSFVSSSEIESFRSSDWTLTFDTYTSSTEESKEATVIDIDAMTDVSTSDQSSDHLSGISGEYSSDHSDHEEEEEEEEDEQWMRGRSVLEAALSEVLPPPPFLSAALLTGSAGKEIDERARFSEQQRRQLGVMKCLFAMTRHREDELSIDTGPLLTPETVVLRAYVIRARGLAARRPGGTCDPYLVMRCGKKEISTRERRLRHTTDPEFREVLELPLQLPGDGQLDLAVMDAVGGGLLSTKDELIGSTTVDLEDLWFSPEWQKLSPKPLEQRPLLAPRSSHAQGRLQCFIELMTPAEAQATPPTDISPAQAQDFELRMVVWQAKNVAVRGSLTRRADLYVTCELDVDEDALREEFSPARQRTDVHWRASGGKASFNYRMRWRLGLPTRIPPRLRIQLWDKKVGSDRAISETTLTLSKLMHVARKKDDVVALVCAETSVFAFGGGSKRCLWLKDLRHPKYDDSRAELQVSLECMPVLMAETTLPAGFGRSAPNEHPHLPKPPGRFKWSLNPFSMLRQLIGGGLLTVICVVLALVLGGVLLVQLAPGLVLSIGQSMLASIKSFFVFW